MRVAWSSLSKDEKRRVVAEGFAAGKTAKQIASGYDGATKNAVIGCANRARLQSAVSVARTAKKATKPPEAKELEKAAAKVRVSLKKLIPHLEIVVMTGSDDPPSGIPFLDRKPGQCAWFLPEYEYLPAEQRRVCGDKRKENSFYSYCPRHHAMVTMKPLRIVRAG